MEAYAASGTREAKLDIEMWSYFNEVQSQDTRTYVYFDAGTGKHESQSNDVETLSSASAFGSFKDPFCPAYRHLYIAMCAQPSFSRYDHKAR